MAIHHDRGLVASVNTEFEMSIVRSRLDGHGIPYVCECDSYGEAAGGPLPTSVWRFYVSPEAAELALSVLRDTRLPPRN